MWVSKSAIRNPQSTYAFIHNKDINAVSRKCGTHLPNDRLRHRFRLSGTVPGLAGADVARLSRTHAN